MSNIYYEMDKKMVINLENKTYKKITKKNAILAYEKLNETYQDAKCSLDFTSPFELVVALILAAQCTDERVNQIVPLLFQKFPTVEKLANAPIEEIEQIIKPCGFFKNKASSIKQSACIVIEKFSGKVPDSMEDLQQLKGIGRKSANIILQECFHHTVGIAVDTHVTRIARKIGLSNSPTPEKIEQDLMKIFPKNDWYRLNHILVYHGRAICIARRPQCDHCPISSLCKKND